MQEREPLIKRVGGGGDYNLYWSNTGLQRDRSFAFAGFLFDCSFYLKSPVALLWEEFVE